MSICISWDSTREAEPAGGYVYMLQGIGSCNCGGWLCSLHKAIFQSNVGPWLAGNLEEKTTVVLGHQDNLQKLKFCHRVKYTHAHTHLASLGVRTTKARSKQEEEWFRPSCCFTAGQVNRSATRHVCCKVAVAFQPTLTGNIQKGNPGICPA